MVQDMKKVEVVESQKKEGSGLFGIVDILVKIILLIMLSLLSRFKIYIPPPPTPTPSLEISVDDQFTIEDITAFDFIPLNININVGDNFYIDDSISYMFIGNEISINVTDVFYLDDDPLISLQYIPINISVTDSFAIEDNTSMQFGTNVVNVSVEDVFYLDDTPSISIRYVTWLTGWSYRKSHVINPSSGAGTNYQVKITVHYGSGTDSGSDVYLGEKCRSDFGDIRFTSNDKTTLIDYWMENKVDGNYATFWVEVPDDLSSNSTTIYIYYGNSSATTTSNGNNTFVFFDDFESYADGSAINNQGGWVTKRIGGSGEATVRLVNGRKHLHLSTTLYATAVNHSCSVSNSGYAMRIYEYGDNVSEVMSMSFTDGNIDTAGCVYNGYTMDWWGWGGAYTKIQKLVNGSGTALASISDSDTVNVYHTLEFCWYGSSLKGYRDETLKISATDTNYTSRTYIQLHVYYPSSRYIDWVLVRKYVEPEPSHGSWGSEESW